MAQRKQVKRPNTTQAPVSGVPPPVVSRPRFPAQYGVSTDGKGMLAWASVSQRLAKAQHYWICTVTPDHRPHATPVDGLWIHDRLYFGGAPETRWRRNLAANPAISIHLESAMEVVMLQGDAHNERVETALAKELAELAKKKYGYGSSAKEYAERGVLVFRPRCGFAWSNLPKDATRFAFGEAG